MKQQKTKKGKKLKWIIIAIIAICVIGGALGGGDEEGNTSSSNKKSETTESTAETTTKATTEATTTATTEATTEATTAKKKLTKKDYNPQITYDDLARTPDKYKYKRITFQGKVVQVMEDDENDQTQIRLATKNGYDDVILVAFDRSIVNTRVLEDDIIRFYGISAGLITYESTMGGNITIPAASAEKIKILN